ncbi:ATP-grasp domain-containing protein [Mesorhizobium waimense]|uniref:ATP-grasp domain-containing protein n=1 Tax=Mesorhizobium waimense TaxID=1300307 RepID=A0A3A5JPY7_9HYPH|nr:ATP-grasp domain-containing protein [Mesorhizobium waimense]RJT20928.1 ATP-grasp domain-containing protein [Mesorhizobium waimense]
MSLKVSFLFGGVSTEYDGSITSLINVISSYLALPVVARPFSVKRLYHISRYDGLIRTIPVDRASTTNDIHRCIAENSTMPGRKLASVLDSIASNAEYIVNLLHGQFGEDGGIQTLAALSGVTGTFGDPHVASLTMNKYAMSAFVSALLPNEVVRVPKTTLVKPRGVSEAIEAVKLSRGPIVVKPNSLGSSLFCGLFRDPAGSAAEIESLLGTIFTYDSAALFQEFIPGDEYTCGCLVSSSAVIPLPVVKLDAEMQFCGRDQKYSDHIAKKTVVDSDNEVYGRVQTIAERIVSSIDIYNMARLDFRVTDTSEVWFLECNYIPGIAKDGSFEMMLNRRGMTVIDLISWIASNATPFIKPEHYINYDRI